MRKWIGGCWTTLGNQSSRRKERGRSRIEVSRVLESASCSASLPSAHSQPLGSSGYFEVLSFFILFLSTHSNTVDHTKSAGQGLKFQFQGNYSLFPYLARLYLGCSFFLTFWFCLQSSIISLRNQLGCSLLRPSSRLTESESVMENILWKFVCTFVHEYGSGMWSTFPRKLEPTFLFFFNLVQCKNTLSFCDSLCITNKRSLGKL